MAKPALAAGPIYHHKRDSIEAHLTIVFAALAISRLIEDTTGWSIKKFVRTARRYRTAQIQAGAPPIPHRPDPGRRPHHHRRRPPTRRPPRSPRRHRPPSERTLN